MATIQIHGHIYAEQRSWEKELHFSFASYDMRKYQECAQVVPHTITAEVPDDFDPRPDMVESLRNEQKKILAEAQVKANAIEERISKLLCLENKA